MDARRGNRGNRDGLVREIETISSPKTLFLGVFFVKADPTAHDLSRLCSLQRHVGSNRLIYFFFAPQRNFIPRCSPQTVSPVLHTAAGKRNGPETLLLPTASPRPPREKGLLPRGGDLSAPGKKAQVFFGVFPLRVMRWGFTFGLNFCSHLPQRRLFTTCSLVSTTFSSSLRGARR